MSSPNNIRSSSNASYSRSTNASSIPDSKVARLEREKGKQRVQNETIDTPTLGASTSLLSSSPSNNPYTIQQRRFSSSPLRSEITNPYSSTSNLSAYSRPPHLPQRTPPKDIIARKPRLSFSSINMHQNGYGSSSSPRNGNLRLSPNKPYHERNISSSAPISSNKLLKTYGSLNSTSSFSPVIPTIDPRRSVDLPRDQLVKILDNHLVTNGSKKAESISGFSEIGSFSDGITGMENDRDSLVEGSGSEKGDKIRFTTEEDVDLEIGSPSHTLLGGFAVRDVYKWKEKDEVNRKLQHRRSKSETHLSDLADDAKSTHSSAREIRQPGGFRRFFVKTKAEKEGKPTPPLTRTFIDFLALYGNFAGEWVWDAEEVQEWGDMDHLSPIREEYQDEELAISYNGGGSEQTPLLGSPRSPLSPSSPRRASHIQGTAGDRKVFLLLIKAFIGTGVLFLPSAFKDGGLTFSAVVMVLIAVLTVHGMLLLFETHKTIPGSFGDIAERCYGWKMRWLVLASITLSQTGFCMAYIIFVAQNAQSVVAHLSNCRYNLPLHYFILLQLILYLPLALVRKIKHFAITSLIADVFILGGLCVIGYYDVDRIVTMGMQRVEHIGKGIAVYLGTACYTFEGICLTLPIAQSMKNPSHFPRILSFTMALTTSIYILIASLSYLAYGPQLRTIVLLNLPASPVTTTTHILYILAIMFTWPLVLFPATRILENAVFPAVSGKNDPWQKWQKNFLRSCLVCVLAVGAWGGSRSLSKFVSLIGSFACIPLSFIYPALFHYKASAVTLRQKVSDILLFIFGVVSMLYVTYVTINTWGVEEGGLDGDMCVGVGHPSGSTGI